MYKNIIPAINSNISQSNKNTVILVYLPEKKKYLKTEITRGTYVSPQETLKEFLYALNKGYIDDSPTGNFTTVNNVATFTFTFNHGAFQAFLDCSTNFYFMPCNNSLFYTDYFLNIPMTSVDPKVKRWAIAYPGKSFIRLRTWGQINVETNHSANSSSSTKIKHSVTLYPGSYTAEYFQSIFSANYTGNTPVIIEGDYKSIFFPDIKYIDITPDLFDELSISCLSNSVISYRTDTSGGSTGTSGEKIYMKRPYYMINGPLFFVSSKIFASKTITVNNKVYDISGLVSTYFTIYDAFETLKQLLNDVDTSNKFIPDSLYTYTLNYNDSLVLTTGTIKRIDNATVNFGAGVFKGLLKTYSNTSNGVNFTFNLKDPGNFFASKKEYHSVYYISHPNSSHKGTWYPRNVMAYFRDKSKDYCVTMAGGNYKPSYKNDKCETVKVPGQFFNYTTYNLTKRNTSGESPDSNNFNVLIPSYSKKLLDYCDVSGYSQCDSGSTSGCDDFRCQPRLTGSCTNDSQCFGTCDTVTKQCIVPGPGTSCKVNSDCLSGTCDKGYCSSDPNVFGNTQMFTRSVNHTFKVNINGVEKVIPRGEYKLDYLLKTVLGFGDNYLIQDSASCYTFIIIKNVNSYTPNETFENLLGLLSNKIVYRNLLVGLLLKVQEPGSLVYYFVSDKTSDWWSDNGVYIYYSIIPPGYYFSIKEFAMTLNAALNRPWAGRDLFGQLFANSAPQQVFGIDTTVVNDKEIKLKIKSEKYFLIANTNMAINNLRLYSIFDCNLFATKLETYTSATTNKPALTKEFTITLKIPYPIKNNNLCFNDKYVCVSQNGGCKC